MQNKLFRLVVSVVLILALLSSGSNFQVSFAQDNSSDRLQSEIENAQSLASNYKYDKCANLFGVCWYWWAGGGVILLLISAIVIGNRRDKVEI